jgi:hypothetical protein
MTPSIYGLLLPHWLLPVIVVGVIGFFLYWVVRGSEAVASKFGKLGQRIYDRAQRGRRMEVRLENIEDKLECAMAFLVDDACYHHEADIIIAENYPGLTRLLPSRMPFTDFARKWRDDGWRPTSYTEA